MKNKITYLLLIALTACSNKVQNVSPEALKQSDVSTQIVDLRTKAEYDKAHVPGAINLNSDNVEQVASHIYKEMPVVLYGPGSDKVAAGLSQGGFRKVMLLEGGIEAWKNAKYDTEKLILYDNDTIPFEKARMGSKLVLVDFNAVWCGPCKRIEPFIKDVRVNRASEVSVYSIDTDQNPSLAAEYKAESIPLLVFIKNNQEVHRSVGLISLQKINQLIDQYK